MDQQTEQEFEQVGTGMAVFTDDAVVEGPLVFLDSPQDVIAFVGGDAVKDTIVLARGGTTTFLTPALTSGVKGVVTLQGAPTSHLGILSREYGIPCVMGVTFEKGVRSSRGEVIPADGVRVRLDVSSAEGRVLVEPGAPVDDTPLPDPDAEAVAMQEQIAVLLERFQGEVPHGAEGDAQVRAQLTTDVLTLTDENTGRDLTVDELNDLQRYMAWNLWDFLALRATEGESGLIPRQEYECFGCIHQWQRYPDFYRLILDRVGVEGVVDIGAIPRREPANKVNLLHVWCAGFTPVFGRALLAELGVASTDDRPEDTRLLLQFMRRLYRGLWGEEGAAMFTSMQGYAAPLLDRSWIDRFAADQVAIAGDEARRSLFQAFNANTEMLGFLLHFDNRSGLNDTGPYDLGDGRFMIVRDHFLHDPMYHWHDVAEGLPHCLTQAMVFRAEEGELTTQLMDGGTLFSEPANYLKHLESMSVYARDTWDTPAAEIRRVDEDEMRAILERCDTATSALYRRIASMPKREKIACGAAVYYGEFVAAVARAAGVWDEMLDELDFWEYDEVTSQAYFPLVRDGLGAQLVGKLFITGTGFAPLSEGAFTDVALEALHPLALRGSLPEVEGGEALAEAGLAVKTPAGWMLTEAGTAKHAQLLAAEAVDRDAVHAAYERFLAANAPFKALNAKWQGAGEDARWELVGELADLVGRAEAALGRTAAALPRFGPYAGRLRAALERVEAGEFEWVTAHDRDSLHTVWMEAHEDFLRTLGISREEEGSF
jgi:phosphohistidine swiveling domain-containing protein